MENSNMTIKHQPKSKHESDYLQWEIKNIRGSQNRVIYINNQIQPKKNLETLYGQSEQPNHAHRLANNEIES